MAKARSRTAARKVKDRWKAKNWYNVLAPESFNHVTVAETLADDSAKLIKRVTEVSLQDITNDFRKSHIKLFFEICDIEGTNAHTQYIGHTLTSDYLRRMIRRKRSKIDGIYDVVTRDGAKVRIKPFATTDHRIQNSQKKEIRELMKKTITEQATANTLSEFIKNIIDGKTGSELYKSCKKIYPVKRVEIYKTHVISQPTTKIETPKPKEKTKEIDEKKTEEQIPKKQKEEITEEKTIEENIEQKEEPLSETSDTPDDEIKAPSKEKKEHHKKSPKSKKITDESHEDSSIDEKNQDIPEIPQGEATEEKTVEDNELKEEPTSEASDLSEEKGKESSKEKKTKKEIE
jgi:small subunit ribosomal protein S3Ae